MPGTTDRVKAALGKRLMIASASWAAVLVVSSVFSARAEVREPYLALRSGLKCSACHVNRSGGGGRNAFGSIYAQTTLPLRAAAVRNRAVSDFLGLGFDIRTSAWGTIGKSTPRTSVELNEANLYLEARLVDRVLALYVDQTLGPSPATAREAFILWETRWLNGYAKAGKFLLPYGLRLPDDQEFIRRETGFSYQTPDQGVEIGAEPGPLSWFVALSNGSVGASEGDDGKQVTASAALVLRDFRIGASASRNEGVGPARRDVLGVFGGFRAGPLVLLGEFDRIWDRTADGERLEQLAAYWEGDVLLARGVNAKVTYGWFDKNGAIPEDERVRARFGLEIFPSGFLRAAAFYTADIWIPQSTVDVDRLSLELQLHF